MFCMDDARLCSTLALALTLLPASVPISGRPAMSLGYSAESSAPAVSDMYNPDVQSRVCTRSVMNLQKEVTLYRSGKDGRGYVHSSGECTYAVLKSRVRWELLGCKGSGLCMGLHWFLVGSSWIIMGLFSVFLFYMDSWACWGWRPFWVLVALHFCGSGSVGLPGCRLLLSGCMSQLTLAPAAWIW